MNVYMYREKEFAMRQLIQQRAIEEEKKRVRLTERAAKLAKEKKHSKYFVYSVLFILEDEFVSFAKNCRISAIS